MGPLYGMTFTEFAEAIEGREAIDAALFSTMLHKGLEGVQSIGSAKVGDKTLLDTFVPAVEAFDAATGKGKSFAEALDALTAAADKGRDSTIDLVAKIGRAKPARRALARRPRRRCDVLRDDPRQLGRPSQEASVLTNRTHSDGLECNKGGSVFSPLLAGADG
jgi:dihydroxyacetone kinase-like protein